MYLKNPKTILLRNMKLKMYVHVVIQKSITFKTIKIEKIK